MQCSPLLSSTAAVAQPVTLARWHSRLPTWLKIHNHQLPVAATQTKSQISAHSRRLQQLAPDLAADAVAADVVPPDPSPAPTTAHKREAIQHINKATKLLEAYPSVISTAFGTGSDNASTDLRQNGQTAAITAAAAAAAAGEWTASDDVDIDGADVYLRPSHTLLQQQQEGQQLKQKQQQEPQPLPQPVLLPLQSQQQQRQGHVELAASQVHFPARSSSSSSRSRSRSRSEGVVIQWQPRPSNDTAQDLGAAAAAAAVAVAAEAVLRDSAGPEVAPEQASGVLVGGFFSSRAVMLQQLQQQQLQVQREHVLLRSKQQLYRYSVSEGGSSINRQPGSAPVSPLRQTTFKFAQQQQQQQQQQRQDLSTNQQAAATAASSPPPPQEQQQQQQQQQGGRSQPGPVLSPPAPTAASAAAAGRPQVSPQDPSRGLCLSAFLYCCSRNELLSLMWQLGLSPAALRFVSRVSDADLVLHVKPGTGERHYQYEDYRAQAADKGIPFIDLKNLSLLELQLYLLPVYRLYAGEVSPRDLLLRKKRRGPKSRYTSIKLPPVKPQQ